MHGIKDFNIINDDTLKNPGFVEKGKLKTFDLVLANPPYSIKQWDRAAFESDKWGRNILGTPPQGRADYAFSNILLKVWMKRTVVVQFCFLMVFCFAKKKKTYAKISEDGYSGLRYWFGT